MKPQNTTTAAFDFCMRYDKDFINENISRLNHDDINVPGVPVLRVHLSQSSQHTYEDRVEWSGHDRVQAKGMNKERERDAMKQTSLFHQVSLKFNICFPSLKKKNNKE